VVPVFDIIFVHLTTLLSDIRSDPILRPTLSLPISPFPDPPSFLKLLARNILRKNGVVWLFWVIIQLRLRSTVENVRDISEMLHRKLLG
jgi:hypothetical protein